MFPCEYLIPALIMCPPTSDMIKAVYNELFLVMETPIGSPAVAHIDKELTPILTELFLTLGPRIENHPTIRQLVNWLVHPQRTVDEFNYVVGPLGHHVYMVMCEHFYDYISTWAMQQLKP